MTTLQLLGYISDAWVLVTYFVLTHTGKHTVAFHWANALGAAPILVAEVQLGAWQVLPLTGTFCAIGWLGLYKAWRESVRKAKLPTYYGTVDGFKSFLDEYPDYEFSEVHLSDARTRFDTVLGVWVTDTIGER